MDFHYTEEQRALRELAGRLLAQRFTDEHRKLFRRGGDAYDATLWAALAEAGVLGTAIAPAQGGSGLGLTELCLVLEEQGRTLAALPLLASLVLGALPLQKFGNSAQRALLQEVGSGRLLLSAALEEAGGDPLEPTTSARPMAGGWRLSGREDLCALRRPGAVPAGVGAHRGARRAPFPGARRRPRSARAAAALNLGGAAGPRTASRTCPSGPRTCSARARRARRRR